MAQGFTIVLMFISFPRMKRAHMDRFNSLELLYKGTLLKKNAHYLMLTLYQHYTVRLYSWDRFFIEHYYDNERGHTTRITIANANDMNKFMKDISIADLGLSTTQ